MKAHIKQKNAGYSSKREYGCPVPLDNSLSIGITNHQRNINKKRMKAYLAGKTLFVHRGKYYLVR